MIVNYIAPQLNVLSQSAQINSTGGFAMPSDSALLTVAACLGGFLLLLILGRYAILNFFKGMLEASIDKKSLSAEVFEVRLPKNNETEIQAADQMFSALLSIGEQYGRFEKLYKARSFVSIELVALPESVRFYVVASKNVANTVDKAIVSAYPSAEVTRTKEHNIFTKEGKVEFAALSLAEENYRPIRTYEELSVDSIAGMLSVVGKLSMGESAAMQIVLTSAGGEWRNAGKKFVKKIRDQMSDPEAKSKPEVAEEVLGGIEKKCEKAGFWVDIRLVSVAPSAEQAKITLDSMVSTFSQLGKEGNNYFKNKSIGKSDSKQFVKDFIYRTSRQNMILNTAELATVIHFPNKNIESAHVNYLISKRAPATAGIASDGDLWLGTNIYRDTSKQIAMLRNDRRRHMYIIGKTGAGKSYFLQQMALQDIINGEGLAFLDPHGDSAEWLIERIPPHRIEDVIYWNPGDTERPMAFNILEFFDEQDKHRVVNAFLGLMQKMFDPHNQGITGPRFERAVRNAMLSVMEEEGATLIEVMRILTDENYAKDLIPKIKDDVVRRYWTDEMAKTQEFHKSEVLGYIVSKFDRFVTNKLTRNIFGQSVSAFNFRQVMDNKKILIVNLSKGTVGEENAQFLGLLLVPKILSAAMSRADTPEDQRKDFYLYVDEFQNFSTEDFASILSEARKYRLNLIVANQYIAQIDEKIRDAVFGNVGTTVSFKVGQTDAQFLESVFQPAFDINDLTNIENTNAYIKMLYKGESPPAFSINTNYNNAPQRFNLMTPGNKKIAEIVKNLSRYRYGRDQSLVESEITKRSKLDAQPVAPAAPGGFGGGFGGGLGGGFGAPPAPASPLTPAAAPAAMPKSSPVAPIIPPPPPAPPSN